MSDIFRDMQAKIGCRYISDLPYYKRAVWYELRRMPLAEYGRSDMYLQPIFACISRKISLIHFLPFYFKEVKFFFRPSF